MRRRRHFTDVRDSRSIAHAMISLMADSSYRQRVAQSGHQHVASTYRKDFIVPSTRQFTGVCLTNEPNLPTQVDSVSTDIH